MRSAVPHAALLLLLLLLVLSPSQSTSPRGAKNQQETRESLFAAASVNPRMQRGKVLRFQPRKPTPKPRAPEPPKKKPTGPSYSPGGARSRFEEKFHRRCSKYPFVEQWLDTLQRPRHNFFIFVFSEGGNSGGGMGDRLAGLISSAAYALRANRTLLVQGDRAFEASFRPYSANLTWTGTNGTAGNVTDDADDGYSWRSWAWSNWSPEVAFSRANLSSLNCVNPRADELHCSLDHVSQLDSYRVVKYYGNRCWLCRWALKPSLGLGPELQRVLGLGAGTDLYEVAGCLLRLAIWPTDALWEALDDSLREQLKVHSKRRGLPSVPSEPRTGSSPSSSSLASANTSSSSPSSSGGSVSGYSPGSGAVSASASATGGAGGVVAAAEATAVGSVGGAQWGVASISRQVGLHFRCGDTSFGVRKKVGSKGQPPHSPPPLSDRDSKISKSTLQKIRKPPVKPSVNLECVFSTAAEWNGTSFDDDKAMDSPLDHAQCARQLLGMGEGGEGMGEGGAGRGVGAGVGAVDVLDRDALAYIASDHGASSSQINHTLAWPFSISPPQPCHMDLQRSDLCTLSTSLHWFMLAQSDAIVMQAMAPPTWDNLLNSPETSHLPQYPEPAPISGFSKYAAIYSLSEGVIWYGRGCRQANTTRLSYETHGNWLCDTRKIF
ncbi:hypothetical protein B484DRAFT_455589 [Ochromonadaceae sp. CCMP2298]|nr:hypothetical protein B484DRAFT_455589 [Ochromonadaceae sp. CCMP2298]